MAYFLRIHKRKRGLYLQIDESFRNKEKKRTDHKSYKSLGYVDDLISAGISDPVSFYKNFVDNLNKERKEANVAKISDKPAKYNVGHFLLKALIDKLQIEKTLEFLAIKKSFQFELSDLIRQLIYARVVSPCSKIKTADKVFPSLFNYVDISSDQVYDGIEFIGQSYKKYIELFNVHYNRIYNRNTSTLFFDCTNYYFEIDLPSGDKQKGPSKENRNCPIISQALLLDANQIPIAMEMFPGNESEKPYIRKVIKDMKARYDISGKTVQVADKGLNCAQNIYEALKNGDGYVFSKSIHGRNLSDVEKKWVLLQNDFVDVKDDDGRVKYKIKECIDTFIYYLTDENGKKFSFKVKEKRVVSFNPTLAKKQRAEIDKQIDKIKSTSSIKAIKKEEYGDAIKYVSFDKDVTPILNQKKIDEDKELCGYNLIVTSEICKSAQEIYNIYHGLWRIEESFRITKSYLDARPVYLQKRESIYGHFLICFLSLFLLRVLEFNIFNNELNVSEITSFIQDFSVTKDMNGNYTNNATDSHALQKIKKILKIEKLDNLYFKSSDIEKVYSAKF